MPLPDGVYSVGIAADPAELIALLTPVPTENIDLPSFFGHFFTVARATVDSEMPAFTQASGVAAIRCEGLACVLALLYSGLKASFADFCLWDEKTEKAYTLTLSRDFAGADMPDTADALAAACERPILPFLLARKIASVSGFSLSSYADGTFRGVRIGMPLVFPVPENITSCDTGRIEHAIALGFSDWEECEELLEMLDLS